MKWISDLIDLIFPRRCAVCGEVLSRQERYICLNCLYTLPKIEAHHKIEIEQTFWGKVDIERATSIARDMVSKYGMSEKLGPISYDSSGHSIFIGRDFGQTKSYSEDTANLIDAEVKSIFDFKYEDFELVDYDPYPRIPAPVAV